MVEHMATFVCVHGYWLAGDSWDSVAAPLRAAGHVVVAPSLATAPSTTFADHLADLRAVIDAAEEPVVLVGSSAAAKHVLALSGERPQAVVLAVYVDSFPQPPERADEPAGDTIAFDWGLLTDDEQRDLTAAQRAWIEKSAVPYPARVARDAWSLDPRAYDVSALVVGTGFDPTTLEEWRTQWPDAFAVVDRMTDLRWAWLPTSHWPQLTRPADLAALLLESTRGSS
jgi:pimeloyl-ACP methyl ester carboxylesterase